MQWKQFTLVNFMETRIQELIEKMKSARERPGLTFYKQASIKEISKFEELYGIKLPDDMRAFYQYCNGFESEEDQFRIIPLQEIIENKDRTENSASVDFDFAEFLYYCDMWTITISKESNNDCLIHNSSGGRTVLTNSFSEFIDRYLTNGFVEGILEWE